MKDQVIRLLGQKDYVPLNVPELLRRLRLPPHRQQELQAVLKKLAQTGEAARIKGNRYVQPREADLIPGRIRMNRAGNGFLQPDDTSLKEIAVPETATGTALHEDHVLVRRDVRRTSFRPGAEAAETGTVVRILERRRTQFVGTLQRGRQFLFVIPDDPRIPHDILVPEPRDVGRPAHVGDKVVVEPRSAGRGRRGHALGAAPIRFAAAFSAERPARGTRHRHDRPSSRSGNRSRGLPAASGRYD